MYIFSFIWNLEPRYEIYPARYIDNIIIEGVPIKGEQSNVTIEDSVPDSCHEPYYHETNINNLSRIVEIISVLSVSDRT